MTRSLSPVALQSLLAEETGEAFHVLLTLTITDNSDVETFQRFTSDAVNTEQAGGTLIYEPFPFDITLPTDEEGKVAEANLTVTNIDRRLIDDIRSYTHPIAVQIQVVLGSDPDDVMAQFNDFILRNVNYDASTISGTLVLENFINEPLSRIMSAANYPGLF